MYPLLICSLIALTIIIERCMSMRNEQVIPEELGRAVLEKKDSALLYEMSRDQTASLPRVIRGLYDQRSLCGDARIHLFKTLFKKEIARFEQGLSWLEVIAAIAPLLGLLGTVLGMVDIFNVIVNMGVGQAKAMAAGISQALITTIAGLTIAIPVMVCHSFLSKRSESFAMQLEEYSQYVLHSLDIKRD